MLVLGLSLAAVLSAATRAGPSHEATGPTSTAPPTSAATQGSSAATSTTTSSRPAGRRTPPPSVTIAAVGDTMLGNAPDDYPPDPAAYFDAVKAELDGGAGIVFGNLEGTLTTATTSKCGASEVPGECYAFKDPPSFVQYFKDAGFTILNDANNHSFDFGAAGQAQTVAVLHAAGLAQTGLPGEITLVRSGGIRVAFVAFAPYSYDANLLDLPEAASLIRRARAEAAVVVVYMHAGAEGPDADQVTGEEEYYLGEDRGNAEAFAHMAIANGASLVIASGPHVLRGMQFYRGHLIAYSLGNFASYEDFATAGDLDESVILHVTLSSAGRFESARLFPVQFVGAGQPVPGGDGIAFVRQLSDEDFGASAARISAAGVVTESS